MARSEPMADDSLPDMRARRSPGTAIAAMTPRTATTISSSISVKPFWLRTFMTLLLTKKLIGRLDCVCQSAQCSPAADAADSATAVPALQSSPWLGYNASAVMQLRLFVGVWRTGNSIDNFGLRDSFCQPQVALSVNGGSGLGLAGGGWLLANCWGCTGGIRGRLE